METRKITVVSTKNQTKKVIMSSATTLAELKADLRLNDIDYEGMTFFEGTSKIELIDDNSILPHDVPYKGTITNELVFMLTNTNKKIKSGVMSRMEVYDEIKKLGLQDACRKKFGKNFTMCKTADLIELIQSSKASNSKTEKEEVSTPVESTSNCNKCVDTVARAAIIRLVEILTDDDSIYESEKLEILEILKNEDAVDTVHSNECNSKSDSPYSDNEIDSMFDFIN